MKWSTSSNGRMARLNDNRANQRRFCWEQVQRTHRVFRISRVFAPPEQAPQLLPLYALFAAVEGICTEHADESVARHKLNWWRVECSGLAQGRSDHPVLRELIDSQAHDRLGEDSLMRLFAGAEARLDARAPSDMEALQSLCRELSRPQQALEAELGGAGESFPVAGSFAASRGLVQLLRESLPPGAVNRYWWLPNDLLARHACARAEAAQNPAGTRVQAVFSDLLTQAARWELRSSAPHAGARQIPPGMRHLYVMGYLQACTLPRLRDARPERFGRVLHSAGLSELCRAWSAARRVSRP